MNWLTKTVLGSWGSDGTDVGSWSSGDDKVRFLFSCLGITKKGFWGWVVIVGVEGPEFGGGILCGAGKEDEVRTERVVKEGG